MSEASEVIEKPVLSHLSNDNAGESDLPILELV
jgi:hypothetical protein